MMTSWAALAEGGAGRMNPERVGRAAVPSKGWRPLRLLIRVLHIRVLGRLLAHEVRVITVEGLLIAQVHCVLAVKSQPAGGIRLGRGLVGRFD